jgi:hypothetical protein
MSRKRFSNLSLLDKTLRLMAAIILAMLFFTDTVTGTLGIVLIVIAAIFLVTSAVGICPVYMAFGIHSNKKRKTHGTA